MHDKMFSRFNFYVDQDYHVNLCHQHFQFSNIFLVYAPKWDRRYFDSSKALFIFEYSLQITFPLPFQFIADGFGIWWLRLTSLLGYTLAGWVAQIPHFGVSLLWGETALKCIYAILYAVYAIVYAIYAIVYAVF